MNRYQGNVNAAINNSTAIQFAASYTVYVTPVGGRAASASSAAVITLDRGHSFRVGDRFLLNPGVDNQLSVAITALNTVTNAITMGTTNYEISAGDVFVNLGPDGSSGTTPDYDTIPMGITDQPDGGGLFATPSVTTDAQGNFEFYHRGDGKFWLLILDAVAAPSSVIQGVGGMSRNNICDYGAMMDGSTDDSDRVEAAIEALPDQGGEVFAPPGDIYMGGSCTVERGSFKYTAAVGSRMVVDASAVFCLHIRGDLHASGRVSNVVIEDLWTYDPDPANHAVSEESHGVRFKNVDGVRVLRGLFDSMGDESIDCTDCTEVVIDSPRCKSPNQVDDGNGAISIQDCEGVRIVTPTITDVKNGAGIRIETSDSPETDTNTHIVIVAPYIDTTADTNATDNEQDGAGIAINPGNQSVADISIMGGTFKDVAGQAVMVYPVAATGASVNVIGINVEGGGTIAGTSSPSTPGVGAITFAENISKGCIIGNTIRNWGDHAQNHGIRVAEDGITIQGNSIHGLTASAYAIRIDGDGTTGNVICGNNCEDQILPAANDLIFGNKTTASNIATMADEATPSVAGDNRVVTGGTANDPITNFDDGVVGQELIIRAAHAVTITHNESNIWLNLGVDYAMEVGSTLTLMMFDAGIWTEIARSDNVA